MTAEKEEEEAGCCDVRRKVLPLQKKMKIIRFLQKKETRKLISRYRFVVMFLLLATMVLIAKQLRVVEASPANNALIRKEIDNMLSGIKTTNIKYMKQVYSNFSSVADPNDGSYTSSLIQKATEFVTGLAIFFCVIFGLIGLIKESQKGEITAEYWTKVFVSTVVAVTVVANINMVMDALYKTGGAFIDGMVTVVDDNTSAESQQVTMDENEKKALLHALSLMPPFNGYQSGTSVPDPNNPTPAPDPDNPDENLTVGTIEDVYYGTTDDYIASSYIHDLMTPMQLIGLLPMLASMYLMYAMVFEIKLRQIFAPLAVAGIALEGARSSGLRFLKKYLACYLRVTMYFAIAALGAMMTNYFYARVITTATINQLTKLDIGTTACLIMMFGSNALAAITMLQTGGLADEIIGV